MTRYSTYRSVDIPWIGEIPSDWTVKKFKHLFNEKKSTKNPSLSSGSISFGKVIFKDDEKIPESTKESYQEVLNGEFLINPLNLNYDLKSLRIGLSRINVVVSQGYIVLQLRHGFVPEYFEYLLRKFDVEYMKSLGQGVRQTISFTHLKDEKLVVPPKSQQIQIFHYLDKKTQQIDSLIDKVQRKIELLKEQRLSLINQFVTEGLIPNVQMKDSGIKWIGEIPVTFTTVTLRWVIDSIKDGTHGTHPTSDEGKILLSGKNVHDGFLKITNNERLIPVDEHEQIIKNGFPRQGDVLVSCVGSIGRSCVFEGPDPVSFQRSVCFIRPSEKLDPYYLSYLIRSHVCQTQIQTLINQSTVGGIYMGDLKNLVVLVPPMEEQIGIVSQLNKKIEGLNSVILKTEKYVELLRDYRQSLISSVVTGKVRVTEDII